jgi:hypothetical protein
MRLATFGLLGLLIACASTAPEGPVMVTEDARTTASCSYLGLVSSVKDRGEAEAVQRMSGEVHDRGGDTLLLTRVAGAEGLAIHGEAYRCGHGHPAVSPPPPR